MPVGVFVATQEVPSSTASTFNTANAFMAGRADWGPFNTPTPITSVAQFAQLFGTPQGSGNPNNSRTSTCATLFDAANTFFNEDAPGQAPTIYVSRVSHGTPTAATIVLAPSAAVTFTAAYAGAGGNGLYVAVTNNTSNVVIAIQDSSGNVLATSPQLTTLAAVVTWAATTGYVTAATSGSTLPSTAAATAMTGGTDNYSSVTVTDVTTALTAFSPSLGPGQVTTPGITNTTLSGIWSALGTHAVNNNRVAVCDMDDNVSAATLVSDLASFGTGSTASYCGFWGGNRNVPGITTGTTRSVAPSSVIAALCARVDATGNPDLAPLGIGYPLNYATTPTSNVSGYPYDTYSLADLNTLNAAGINTFQRVNGQPCNYGFVSAELSSSDVVYWQFNHARLRMYIVAQSQILGQQYVGAQIDPGGSTQNAFQTSLEGMLLKPLASAGALWYQPGSDPTTAYQVDVGADVNTPATMAAGQLNAKLTVSFSYFAQQVQIIVNVVPVTQNV